MVDPRIQHQKTSQEYEQGCLEVHYSRRKQNLGQKLQTVCRIQKGIFHSRLV
jgi:hypothetical protein